MIKFLKGNLFDADVDALVNTVNCMGVMGKGIALQFKMAFPENFKQYHSACRKKEVEIGKMFITKQLIRPKYIINFPTKKDWKHPSKIDFVKQGLIDLKNQILKLKIESIAIPPLGAGLGGLDWQMVKDEILKQLTDLKNVDIFVYEPSQSPSPDKITVNTKKPEMTTGRAILLSLINQYNVPGYNSSLLEIQKLMYFVQEAGEKLRLKYEKNKYGPYANNLSHLLQKLEGHFISGIGDRTRKFPIKIIGNGLEKSNSLLKAKTESLNRLKKVVALIKGFETPYGLELLSTVHWIMKHENRTEKAEIISSTQKWSFRKKNLFQPNHINKAIDRLNQMEMV